MDVVGSEIGQKMRSAIKAKLTELGCYVDDELPDYVMVMVANKRTRVQMEEDLQLFLGDNTVLFVNWLHQVLKKLQEVTVTAPINPEEVTSKDKPKEKKLKDKKKEERHKLKKTDGSKKAKKKDKLKEKSQRKKEDKKLHKSKKKSKHHEMIRPNVPPLLMNMEKVSEPSITDVFAGQILKNHGITVETTKEEKQIDIKPVVNEIKRPILQIIDPATISTQLSSPTIEIRATEDLDSPEVSEANSISTTAAPRDEQIKEMNEIEAKIQGLRQKLVEQLDSMSDDEDFLTIRTEAEELMNDFAEDVFQEISAQAPAVATPPIAARKTPSPSLTYPTANPLETPTPKETLTPNDTPISKETHTPKETPIEPETLPQIELKLPKRPVRERLGLREEMKNIQEVKEKEKERKRTESPERFTPDREPDFWGKAKPTRSRVEPAERSKRISATDGPSDKTDSGPKRISSMVSESRPRAQCASVVRVRPRPRVAAPSSSLLMRAVADAHKSLLNIPPKPDTEPQKVKRALVLPMRRCVDAQKIVIQVPGGERRADTDDDDKIYKHPKIFQKEEYVPASFTKKITNTEYVPSRRPERTSSRRDDTLIIETINIHNPTVDKDKNTQFIVTMDGFNTNAFLAKKLMTEGLLNDDEELIDKPKDAKSVLKINKETDNNEVKDKFETTREKSVEKAKEKIKEKVEDRTDIIKDKEITITVENVKDISMEGLNEDDKRIENDIENIAPKATVLQKKRLSNTSEDSDTQVIIQQEDKKDKKRAVNLEHFEDAHSLPVKKRKASPIVFDVEQKKDEEKGRERTESISSDNHVTVVTTLNSHKYDSLPPLSIAERKLVKCRSFPLCRYGASCAFLHPRCKFAAACTRRSCIYSHGPTRVVTTTPPPVVASHVVPVANYKTISPGVLPSLCKFYPNCVNPGCHFFHPKPCRFGKGCANKLECNFYHSDVPIGKWQYPV